MSYLSTIERFYLVLRRQGLMLSAHDVALIERWEAAGVPVDTVCRALLSGAERFRQAHGDDARLPKSLRYYEAQVRDELEKRRDELPVPEPYVPDADLSEDLTELAWIGHAETDPRRKEAYRAAWRALSRKDSTDRLAALKAADDAAVSAFFQSMDAGEKRTIEETVERILAQNTRDMGRRGKALRKQALLQDLICERYGLVRLTHSRKRG